ncbi:Vacuolar protein sorting-associated protein 13 [Artemisia annua]|uniref:Vacuolar protein sorting-associated protein 13 n=1 Tax=Artemisia annua TaxID=35608 RepID=A0A2U1ND31_ARTAN|nr:Vacuolar protein sorting-associated protein 13 [Artemisia annua]
MEMVNVGYEVYADGLTRVLRISECNDSRKWIKYYILVQKLQLESPVEISISLNVPSRRRMKVMDKPHLFDLSWKEDKGSWRNARFN